MHTHARVSYPRYNLLPTDIERPWGLLADLRSPGPASASPTPGGAPGKGTAEQSYTCTAARPARTSRSPWPKAFGIHGRGAFYDRAGAVRDLVQNHLLQVLSNVAMEPPPDSEDAETLRDEKVKVLKAIPALTPGASCAASSAAIALSPALRPTRAPRPSPRCGSR